MRVLVAAFGNELRGDDGFGIAVLRRLEGTETNGGPHEVRLLEVGTGGLWLAQELLSRYDRLIIVDAVARGTAPGTICVLKIDDVAPSADVDMHLTVPSRALAVAKAMGALPAETFLVGCEAEQIEELTLDLSPAVRGAVDLAAHHVRALMESQ